MRIAEFKLERYFARHEFTAPYLLCASDAETFSVDELLAIADPESRGLWETLRLGYTEAPGQPALRSTIAALYERVSGDDVIVFSGAEEAIFAFANAALSAGDHVVAMWPAYQSLHEAARAAGADVTPLALRYDRRWALDVEEVASLLLPSTRAVIVNLPHNPTGMLPDHDTFAALAALCERRGVMLFCDEVYRYGEYLTSDRLMAACDATPMGISLGGLAKPFGLAGLRIGWLVLRDAALRSRVAAFKDYLTICNSAPSEILALMGLRAMDAVLERNAAIARANLALLDDFFDRRADRMKWVRPRAGTVGFPLLVGDESATSFAQRLVAETGVLLAPGSIFDFDDRFFRVGFGRRNMPEALSRLDAFLR